MSVPSPKNHQPTYIDDRFPGPDPYAPLHDLPTFSLTSGDFADGDRLPSAQLGGNDISPSLTWSGAPEDTVTYAVTCFDPDAPTGSGYWHWAVFNLPATVTSLPAGAGDDELIGLSDGAVALRGDSGRRGFYGAQPPAGHGPHRYLYAVHAVPEVLDIPDRATPAVLGFNLNFRASARAILWGWTEN